MLEKEFEFYENNKSEIRERHLGKKIVIVGDQIIGVYDDIDKAYQETLKTCTYALSILDCQVSISIIPLKK
jgi:hypothetical protein